MLVLSRKENEEIVLRKDGEIVAVVTLVRLGKHTAKIGFAAGAELKILRRELDKSLQSDADLDAIKQL